MKKLITHIFKERAKQLLILVVIGIVLNTLVYTEIRKSAKEKKDLRVHFLDVGQGDATLVILPKGIKLLVDGGPPNDRLLEQVGEVLKTGDRYIDLVMLSHPELDHFGGLIELVERYKVGAFISNGRLGKSEAWRSLENALETNQVRKIILQKGDEIRFENNKVNILSPSSERSKDKELNETSIVAELESKGVRALFTGDSGIKVEKELIENGLNSADILKVGHHGSKYSTSKDFINAVRPRVAIIEVGKNSYGHPTREALERLETVDTRILRTDLDGRVEIVSNGEQIGIFKKNNVR